MGMIENDRRRDAGQSGSLIVIVATGRSLEV
jgi:hypothetical protein